MNEVQESFQYWLAHMDDALEEFLVTLPSSVAAQLDYSPDSLPALERWWLGEFESVDEAMAYENRMRVDFVARYVGEVFRKNLNGKWRLQLDDPKYAYYNLPVILFDRDDRPTECPISLTTAALDRRTGKFWTNVFRHIEAGSSLEIPDWVKAKMAKTNES